MNNKYIGSYASLFIVCFLFVFGNILTVEAAPLFNPGQTLDPNCLPTNTDCTVSTSWLASSTSIYFNTGNVGIGTSSPTHPLSIQVTDIGLANFNLTNNSTAGGPQPTVNLNIAANGAKANDGNSKVYGYLTTLSVNDGASAPQGYYSNVNHIDVYNASTGSQTGYGVYGSVQTKTGGAVTPVLGTANALYGETVSRAGTITTANGLLATVSTGGAGAITVGNGIRVDMSGTVGTARGIYVPSFSSGTYTTRYGAEIGEKVRIYTPATDAANPALQVLQNTSQFAALFGADITGGAITDSTRKSLRIGMPHYLTSEEPVSLLTADINTSTNDFYIGGGTGAGNAVTGLHFYTAASNTTTTGSERMVINSAGNVGIGTTSPSQRLEVNGGMRLDTSTAKPTCDSTTRGTFWFVKGGAGVADTVEACGKSSADSYSWVALGTF